MYYWVIDFVDGEYEVLMANFANRETAVKWAISYADNEALNRELFVMAVEKKNTIRRQAVSLEAV